MAIPNPIVTVTATPTGGTTAALALVDTNSGTASHRWRVRLAGGPWGLAAGAANPSAPGVTTFAATGLTPGQEYEVSARPENVDGVNNYVSSAASWYTHNTGGGAIGLLLPDSTIPTLTGSLTVDFVSATWVQVSHPAGADNLPDALSYEYSSNGGSSWASGGVPYTNAAGTVVTYTFTGLLPATSQGLRARAKDRAGNVSTSPLSATQSTTPLVGALDGAVAPWLQPYAALEVLDETAWLVGDFAPYAYGAIGFRVRGGQTKVNGGVRSEASIDFPWVEGDTVTYTYKFMVPASVPSDSPRNHWWIITQWHDQPDPALGETWETWAGGHSPPLSISFGEISGASKLSINAGAPNPTAISPLVSITRGVWYDAEMVVKWSREADGTAVFKLNGTPVWGYAGANMQNAYRHYWKLGQYRSDTIAGISVMHFDAIDASVAAVSRPTLTGSITVSLTTARSIRISHPAGSVGTTSYEYSKDGGITWVDSASVATTYTYPALTPATAYPLQVRAKNAAGVTSLPPLAITHSTSAAESFDTPVNRLSCVLTGAPGTSGNFAVGAARTGHRGFVAGHDARTFSVAAVDGANWEIRTGCTYTHGTTTLSRGTLEESSSGSAVNLGPTTVVSVILSAVQAAAIMAALA